MPLLQVRPDKGLAQDRGEELDRVRLPLEVATKHLLEATLVVTEVETAVGRTAPAPELEDRPGEQEEPEERVPKEELLQLTLTMELPGQVVERRPRLPDTTLALPLPLAVKDKEAEELQPRQDRTTAPPLADLTAAPAEPAPTTALLLAEPAPTSALLRAEPAPTTALLLAEPVAAMELLRELLTSELRPERAMALPPMRSIAATAPPIR